MLRIGLWPDDSFTVLLSPILHCPGFSLLFLLFVIHAAYKHIEHHTWSSLCFRNQPLCLSATA